MELDGQWSSTIAIANLLFVFKELQPYELKKIDGLENDYKLSTRLSCHTRVYADSRNVKVSFNFFI
jgi:hypothetical protein